MTPHPIPPDCPRPSNGAHDGICCGVISPNLQFVIRVDCLSNDNSVSAGSRTDRGPGAESPSPGTSAALLHRSGQGDALEVRISRPGGGWSSPKPEVQDPGGKQPFPGLRALGWGGSRTRGPTRPPSALRSPPHHSPPHHTLSRGHTA